MSKHFEKVLSKAFLCKIEDLKMVTTLEAFQMLCRDLYLPFTAVLTVAGLSQRKDRSNVHMHTFFPIDQAMGYSSYIQDLTFSYRERISYSIIRDKRTRNAYKMYKKWVNLESWKQLLFSTPPERLPVRCKHTY